MSLDVLLDIRVRAMLRREQRRVNAAFLQRMRVLEILAWTAGLLREGAR